MIDKEILDEFEKMTPEEYTILLDKARGYSDKDIPVSNIRRIVEISSCRDCPNLKQISVGFLTAYECSKSRKQTSSDYYPHSYTLAILKELHKMFEECKYLEVMK